MQTINLEKFEVNEQEQSIVFSCATEFPYTRFDQKSNIEYDQILVINEQALNLERLKAKAPVLWNHDANIFLGAVQQAWIAEQRVFVKVRFSPNDEFSVRVFKDILSGILAGISIGYQIEDFRDVKENEIYKRYVTKWTIYQVSVAPCPADIHCGIRKLKIKEVDNMKKNIKQVQQQQIEKDTDAKLEQEQAKQEQEQEVNKQQESQVAEQAIEKTNDEQNVEKDEIAELKAQIEKLKEQIANKECGQKLEQKQCGEEKEQEQQKIQEKQCSIDDQSKRQMEKIADDFGVPKDEVQKALDKKLTVKQFKNVVKNFNIKSNNKENKKMNRFADYLKQRNYEKPFLMRDFTGFSDSDLVGTQTTPLVAALDKRLGVKGFRALNGLHSNISIPVQTTRIEVADKDICAPATDSNPAFTAVELSPNKITGSVLVCKQMLVNTNSDVEAFIIDSLLKEISYKIEQKMLGAVASSAATTITYSNINSITWADILAMQAAIDGYLINNTSFVMNPAARAALKATPKASDTITGFICEDNEVNGYKVNVTGVALNDNIYFGDWNQLVLATWGEGIEILVDPYTESRAGNVVIVASALVDAAVVQPDAFAIGKVQSSSSDSSESSASI